MNYTTIILVTEINRSKIVSGTIFLKYYPGILLTPQLIAKESTR